ncbi:MAG TPA: hypothetical protein VHF25_11035, partial [Nitriliruptorales bacterium]|nr:hypothetical protein [Nitriliruptorales bacterium]
AGGWGDPAGGWGEPAESQTAEPGTAIHLPGDVAPADAARSVSDVVSYSLREEALAGIRPGMVRRLKRNLQDVQNGVLDTLRRAAGGGEVDTPSGDDLHALARVGEPFLVEAYRVGLRDGARLADVAPIEGDVDAAPARAAAEALGEELAHEIAASLEPTLRAGLDAGEDISSLSDRVGEVFRDLKGPVAEAAVHEHLTRTYGLGVHDGWGAGGVTARVWVLGDEPRCPENRCRSNASEGPVALDREFPSGHLVPPAHPGSTCTVAPAEA